MSGEKMELNIRQKNLNTNKDVLNAGQSKKAVLFGPPRFYELIEKHSFNTCEAKRAREAMSPLFEKYSDGDWDIQNPEFDLMGLLESYKQMNVDDHLCILKAVAEYYLNTDEYLDSFDCIPVLGSEKCRGMEWEWIANNFKLSNWFMKKYITILGEYISYTQNLSLDFIREMREELDWYSLIDSQKLTRDFLYENREFIKSLPNYESEIKVQLFEKYDSCNNDGEDPDAITYKDIIDIFYDDCPRFCCVETFICNGIEGRDGIAEKTQVKEGSIWVVNHFDENKQEYELFIYPRDENIGQEWIYLDNETIKKHFSYLSEMSVEEMISVLKENIDDMSKKGDIIEVDLKMNIDIDNTFYESSLEFKIKAAVEIEEGAIIKMIELHHNKGITNISSN